MDDSSIEFRPDMLALGYTDRRLGGMCRRGELRRIRRGAYVDPAEYAGSDKRGEHLLAVSAAVRALHRPAVVSHTSAAALHGLPFWNVTLARVHMTRPGRSGGNSTARKVMHALPLSDDEQTTIDGVTTTSLARTIADVARMGLVEQAVIMGDYALNRALTTSNALKTAAMRVRGCHGSAHSRAAVRAMDFRSESPGETRCRLVLIRAGLAPTSLQQVVRHNGQHIARVDFADEDHGIVTEFDGMLKYKLDGIDAADQSRVLAHEKEREEQLTNLGLRVVRVTWKDLSTPSVIKRRYANALHLAGRSPAPLWDPPRACDAYRCRQR